MNNCTLNRWQDALTKTQEAHNQAVFGETLEGRSELINVLDEIKSLVEEQHERSKGDVFLEDQALFSRALT